MKSVHGHEVLDMMHNNSYNEESLLNAITHRFGANTKFHTCSKKDMSTQELINFFKLKGKFKAIAQNQFSVDSTKICNH